MQLFRSSRQAGGKRPPCVATPTSAVVGLEAERVVDRRRRSGSRRASPPRASSRGSRRPGRRRSGGRRAPSCRSAGRPRSPRRGSGSRFSLDTEPRLARREPGRRRRTRRPGHGSSREQEVAVEVDVVAERRDGAAGGDAEARLDHAAEHHAEPERARRVRHPHRLADAARLRELDVDAVRDLRARGDVGERVAVLVDVDRDRRARLQLARRPRRRRGSGCSQYSTPSSASCGSASSASSSDHHSLTSTCSGSSVTAAHGAHALDVEPVAAAELQLQPPEARRRPSPPGEPCRPDRRARPSTRSAGPSRGRPSSRQTGMPSELALQVVERRVERRTSPPARPDLGEPRADLLERERVVAEQRRRAPRRRRARTRPISS